jgi:hypothetical protein
LEWSQDQVSYLLGNAPDRWRTDIPTFARVRYHELYPGVDLDFYGLRQELEYDFIVAPGADPGVIALGMEGGLGLAIDADGDLVVRTGGGDVRWRKPYIYQEIDGARREVAGGYVLNEPNQVGFWIGLYDPSSPLVIDPVLVYSTLLGGDDVDQGQRIAVDESGHAYVAGFTTSSNFPTVSPLLAEWNAANDVFVTKMSIDGSGLVFSTYLGGSDLDEAYGIAVDAEGNVYVGGVTV